MDPVTTYQFIQTGGVIAILILVIVGFVKKWWVMGWQYKAVEESNARWMELALKSANLVESLDELRKSSGLKLQ